MFFESCLDEEEMVAKLGAEPILNMIEDIGGWAIINENFDIKKWNFQKTFDKIHNTYNQACIFAWSVVEDYRNPTLHSIVIQYSHDVLTLVSKENYLVKSTQNNEKLKKTLDFMTKFSILLGANNENETRKKFQKVIEFETELAAKVILEKEKAEKITLKELQEKAGFINWRKHFQTAFKSIDRKVTGRESISIASPKYLTNITPLIKKYTSTDEGKM